MLRSTDVLERGWKLGLLVTCGKRVVRQDACSSGDCPSLSVFSVSVAAKGLSWCASLSLPPTRLASIGAAKPAGSTKSAVPLKSAYFTVSVTVVVWVGVPGGPGMVTGQAPGRQSSASGGRRLAPERPAARKSKYRSTRGRGIVI